MVEQAFRVRKGLTVANTTASANLDPVTLTVGTTIVNSTAIATGANVLLSVSDFKIGFGTANLHANSSLVKVANTTGTANLQPTQLVIGTSVVNTIAVAAGVVSTSNVAVTGNVNVTGSVILSAALSANGSVGASNQLLTSNASVAYWANAPTGVTYATDAQVKAATAGSLAIKAEQLETVSAIVALTDAATIAVDWDSGINFSVTLTTSRILGLPTNGQPGTWRTIMIKQPVAGSAVFSYPTGYIFPFQSTIDLSPTGDSETRLAIFCRTASIFEVYLLGYAIGAD